MKNSQKRINRCCKGMQRSCGINKRENGMALSSTPPKNKTVFKRWQREWESEKSLILVPTGLSCYHRSPTTDISLYRSVHEAQTLESAQTPYSQKGSERLLFLPLTPPPSLTGLPSNSFRNPRELAFPWNLPKWHNIRRFAYAKRVSNRRLLLNWPIACCGKPSNSRGTIL